MKARRRSVLAPVCHNRLHRLGHQELVGEVIHQVQTFRPDNKLIRQRIEGLIEREYLQRDAADSKKYLYLP